MYVINLVNVISQTGELYVWGSAGKGETGMRSPQLLTVPTLNTFLPKEAGGVTSIATAKQAVVVSMGSGDAYIWGETFAYTSVYRTGLCACPDETNSFFFNYSCRAAYRGITRAKTKQLSGELPGISWSPVAALWEPLRDWQISSVAIGTSHLVFLTDNGEGLSEHSCCCSMLIIVLQFMCEETTSAGN